MGFTQWFWRLFLIFAGLVLAHVMVATLLVTRQAAGGGSAASLAGQLWLSGAVVIGLGAVAIWYGIHRIIAPLAELSRNVRAISTSEANQPLLLEQQDELGALTGAFEQMQRDLARRLAQIQANNERLQTVLSSMTEGVLAVSPDKTIVLANEAGRRLLDFALPDPLGRSLLEATRARPVVEAVTRALADSVPIVTEFDAPGVVRRTLSLRATRLPGQPCPGVMLVLHDMTELRRLESLRRELVANVSHELKTPLSAIKGYAETLRLGAVNDTEHNLHFVRRIEEQADRLHELILDILKIARLESGQESFELVAVPLAEVLEQCGDQFAEMAMGKQIEFVIEPVPPLLTAHADAEGLHTIVSNLVDNALKYTPAGGHVTIRALAEENHVIVDVEDNGLGIPQAEQARIFERFYRVDKARSRELGGTGLGLSIVKHFAQAFGGSVSVESEPGRGSRFRVVLLPGTNRRATDDNA